MTAPAIRMPRRSLGVRIAGRISHNLKALFHVSSFLKNEDRRVLEQVIFQYFLRREVCRDVLFVGCDWYTEGYNKWFEEKKNYWTIDVDPSSRKYGAKQHIVDRLQDLGRHFQVGTFDVIVCNGVFGWGLDARPDVEQAFLACYRCLRDDGVLVIGWDDVEERCPFPLEQCRSLRVFAPFTFPPLGTSEYQTATPYRHTYTFYVEEEEGRRDGTHGGAPTGWRSEM